MTALLVAAAVLGASLVGLLLARIVGPEPGVGERRAP